MSGRLDSNQRLPAPKAGALAGLSYAPLKNGLISALSVCLIADNGIRLLAVVSTFVSSPLPVLSPELPLQPHVLG